MLGREGDAAGPGDGDGSSVVVVHADVVGIKFNGLSSFLSDMIRTTSWMA